MNVVLLGPYPPPHGGVQTNLVAIRELLLERGHGCAVINLHRFRTAKDAGVHHPVTARATLGLLRTLPCDVIHLHLGGDLTLRLLGLALACTMRPKAKSVLTFHSGGYATSEAGRRAKPASLAGMVLRRFDRVIAVNSEIAELFGRFGIQKERIRLIPPHPQAARPNAELPETLQEFFCLHRPVLTTVGLLEPEYDLALQIEALGEVRKRFPKAGLLIAGAGSLESELKARIAAQPWAEHILLAGDVPHPATLRAIADSDALLRTTLYDGDAVAVREALHLGTPVIATDNGMRPAGVRLIPIHDREALLKAVDEALAEGRRLPAAAPAAEDHIETVLKLYEELTTTC